MLDNLNRPSSDFSNLKRVMFTFYKKPRLRWRRLQQSWPRNIRPLECDPTRRLNDVVTRTTPRHKVPYSPFTRHRRLNIPPNGIDLSPLISFFGLTKSFLRNEKSILFDTDIVTASLVKTMKPRVTVVQRCWKTNENLGESPFRNTQSNVLKFKFNRKK